MRKRLGKCIVLFFIGICVIFSSCIVVAEPVVDVSVEPLQPEPLSIVTITANITSEDSLEEVYIRIGECKPTFCYLEKNVSMEFNGRNYSIDYTLEHSDATYFNYSLNIKSGVSWYKTEETKVILKINTNNGGNTKGNSSNTDKESDKGLPGFEILVLLVAVFVTLIYYKRKRV